MVGVRIHRWSCLSSRALLFTTSFQTKFYHNIPLVWNWYVIDSIMESWIVICLIFRRNPYFSSLYMNRQFLTKSYHEFPFNAFFILLDYPIFFFLYEFLNITNKKSAFYWIYIPSSSKVKRFTISYSRQIKYELKYLKISLKKRHVLRI